MKHECRRPCYEDCSKCTIEVEKVLPRCGHSQVMMCGTNSEEVKCKRRCSKILPCGHKCPLTCADKCGGCRVTVTKVIPECGHKVGTSLVSMQKIICVRYRNYCMSALDLFANIVNSLMCFQLSGRVS
jgi:hypothetical protein